MNKLTAILFVFLMAICSSNAYGQTTYKSDPGFFTPVVKSLYLRGGDFEETQLIGPALGYRFNETVDMALHTEFLSSETTFNNGTNPETSLLNLGVIIGRTHHFSGSLMLRSEASFYKSIVVNTNGYSDLPDPSLTSGMISSSLYRTIALSESVSLLPNAGAFLGYGEYISPYSSVHLRQGFDCLIIGPRLGFDASFKLSESFYLIASPQINIPLNMDDEYSEGTLLFNVQLNF